MLYDRVTALIIIVLSMLQLLLFIRLIAVGIKRLNTERQILAKIEAIEQEEKEKERWEKSLQL